MPRENTRSDSYEALLWDVVTNAHRYIPTPGDRVLDLGAHFGVFSLYCASRGCNVVAYEPLPEAFRELQHSARVADEIGLGKIFPQDLAVWSGAQFVTLWKPADMPSAIGSVLPIPVSFINPSVWRVPAISLRTALGYADVDCVKVDIEGAEYEVFRAAEQQDLDRIKFLTLEIHNDLLPKERREELIAKLVAAFPQHEKISVKVNGQPTDDIATLLCWR